MPKLQNALMEGSPIHGTNFFIDIALRIIAKGAFGSGFSTTEECEALRDAYSVVWSEMERQVSGNAPEATSERMELFYEGLRYFSDTAKRIAGQRREGDPDHASFIDYLLAEKSDQHIADEVITFLVGGFHTSGNLLNWASYYLAKHPNEQLKIQEELDYIDDPDVLNLDSIEMMPKMRNMLDETLRLSVLAPWGARVNYRGPTELPGGYVVEKGVPILTPFGVLLRDPNLWENVDAFNPDRFNNPDNKTLKFSPFGFAGGRSCPGQNMAYYETTIILGTILKQYSLSLAPNHPEVGRVHGLVTKTSQDIMLNVSRRN